MQQTLLILIAFIAIGAGVFYITSNPTNAPSPVEETPRAQDEMPSGQQKIAVAYGKTVKAYGLSITLHEVTADYRCPVEENCGEGGAIVADVTFESNGETMRFNMPSDEAPREWEGYSVSIVSVEPILHSGVTIPKEQYRVTFVVVPQEA